MDAAAMSSAIAKFSLKFCKELEKDKSVVSSPMSAEILLALLALGASDPAHKELLSAIGVKNNEEVNIIFNIFKRRASEYYGFWYDVGVRHDINNSQTNSFGVSAEVVEHCAKAIGKPKMNGVLAVYIAPRFSHSGTLNRFSSAAIRASFSSVTTKLKKVKGITLNVANKVYLQTGHELDSDLKKEAVKVFDAGLEPLDFANSAASAKVINDWVESKTNNKIKDLISPDALNSLTRLVLVNAIYFKGKWKHPFRPQNTEDKPFHVKKGTTVNIPMMYMEESFKYAESQKLNAQLLEMPYVGEEASMVIILPNEVDGINGLLKKLTTDVDLMQELTQMFSTKVQVTIPKFKIETEIDLKDLLPKLGIKAIFNEGNSGLTKIMKTTEPIYVSKAVQKAFIEVNEEGAEAAAATGMAMVMCSAMVDFNPVPKFVADRPFLTVIMVDGIPYFIATHHGH